MNDFGFTALHQAALIGLPTIIPALLSPPPLVDPIPHARFPGHVIDPNRKKLSEEDTEVPFEGSKGSKINMDSLKSVDGLEEKIPSPKKFDTTGEQVQEGAGVLDPAPDKAYLDSLVVGVDAVTTHGYSPLHLACMSLSLSLSPFLPLSLALSLFPSLSLSISLFRT